MTAPPCAFISRMAARVPQNVPSTEVTKFERQVSVDVAAKGGVRSMTRNLASELAPRRIRVNQVTPGGTKTPIWSAYAPDAAAMTQLEARISRIQQHGPQLLQALKDLVAWAEQMGGWDAPVWVQAEFAIRDAEAE